MRGLEDFFLKKISRLRKTYNDKIDQESLIMREENGSKKLCYMSNSYIGGHVVSRILVHIDDATKKALYQKNMDFLKQFSSKS